MIRNKAIIAPFVIAIASVASAQVHVTDIILRESSGMIETGIVDTMGSITYGERVFPGTFGEIPNWTNDPGYDSEPGSLPANLTLHIDIADAVRAWDGNSFLTIAQERISVTKSGVTATSPITPQLVPGPVLGSTNAAGVFHHHAGYELLAPAGTGVYLLALQLRDQAGAITTSETFWIVMNQNDDPQTHLSALKWARSNLASSCYADCDLSSTLNILDYICFGDDFAAGGTYADCDGSSSLNILDYICFGDAFAAGCP